MRLMTDYANICAERFNRAAVQYCPKVYNSVQRRIESNATRLCEVEFTLSFLWPLSRSWAKDAAGQVVGPVHVLGIPEMHRFQRGRQRRLSLGRRHEMNMIGLRHVKRHASNDGPGHSKHAAFQQPRQSCQGNLG